MTEPIVQPIVSPYATELNGLKITIFMEVRPGSDEFEQVMLTAEQHQKFVENMRSFLSNCKQEHMPDGKPCNGVSIFTNPQQRHEFPGIKLYYSQAEIDDELPPPGI